jgi:hypothetical protein
MFQVDRRKDDRHAAFAQLAFDAVLLGKTLFELLLQTRHGRGRAAGGLAPAAPVVYPP